MTVLDRLLRKELETSLTAFRDVQIVCLGRSIMTWETMSPPQRRIYELVEERIHTIELLLRDDH